jgi:hypothetical protein
MLTSVAFVVCHASVIDWPGSIVFGLADSDAVGAVGEGGGGGGGGATFLAHAATNIIAPRTNTSVPHRVIFTLTATLTAFVALAAVACFTDSSSFLCAALWLAICRFTAGRTLGQPQNRFFFLKKNINLYHRAHRGARRNTREPSFPVIFCAPGGKDFEFQNQFISNSSWAACSSP